jgi:SAM-dependent methyltransferase
MHDTAMLAGKHFAKLYGKESYTVVDIGGLNINGSLRSYFEELGMKYIVVDMEQHNSVDIVVKPGEKLPFEDGSIDLIVSSSCFEHDPCFWITFKEMCRIIKDDGYIYVNAPVNGVYHGHPGDNWRFFRDAGQSLAYWSGLEYGNIPSYPVKVVETFYVMPMSVGWIDFVCIWQRTKDKTFDIVLPNDILFAKGLLRRSLEDNRIACETQTDKWSFKL